MPKCTHLEYSEQNLDSPHAFLTEKYFQCTNVSHIFCICSQQHLIEAAVHHADSELNIHTHNTVFMAAALYHVEIF